VVDHRALFDRVVEIHNAKAWDRLGEVFTEDAVEEYPQSGEVFRGLANIRAVREHYPGMDDERLANNLDRSSVHLAASDEQWVVTPLFTAVRVEGSGRVGTAVFRLRYPDGAWWWNLLMYELRDEKIAHVRDYWAPEFASPDWRAPYRAATPTSG
jgi:hypothetical protein